MEKKEEESEFSKKFEDENENKQTNLTRMINDISISSFFFFPRKASNYESVLEVPCKDGTILKCSFFDRKSSITVVHFHGNGEIVPDYYCTGFFEFLQGQNISILFVEYRGYGGSTGSTTILDMLDDVSSIYTTLKIPEDKIIVFGRSIGSLFAIEWISRFPKTKGLILDSGIADPLVLVRRRKEIVTAALEKLNVNFDQLEEEAKHYFNHEQKLRSYPGNALILHTQADRIIPVESAHSIHSWLSTNTTSNQLEIFQRGDHNSIYDWNEERYKQLLLQFLSEKC